MSEKERRGRKAGSGDPPGADKSGMVPDPAAKTPAKRDSSVTADEQAVRRRVEASVQRRQAASLREGTAGLRQKAAALRKGPADQREDIADQREVTADLRQDIADQREDIADQREQAASDKATLSTSTQTQLRKANENLVVATIHAQTMKEAAEVATKQMSHMAQHDFLTGLPNRVLMIDRLAQSISLAQRHGKKVALMYMDLDHFKYINDSLGHAVGDKLLQSVANRLQTCVRRSDTVCRQGGDEFVVLLSEVDHEQGAVLTAENLIEAMAQPHLVCGQQLRVTISIGISFYPDDGRDAETLARNADTAMYQAKKIGRNTYRVFTPEMIASVVARQSVEQALHRALEQRKFVLHYQPKVNLETGAITGAEALIRMQGPDDLLVSPEHFIGIAEECGLILPIGRWVLEEACRQARSWLQAGLDIGQIAVNVSSNEFHNKDFLAGVLAVLEDTGLDPHRLEIEMTESGLMQDMASTIEILSELKKLGVWIAIDDFGTGFSSLRYLLRFPIDTIKIDRSFVRDLDVVTGDKGNICTALVNAVIALGKSLSQRVVAEGVETQQQLAFLQSHHCAEGQGFYFSRPVPADEFASLLATDLLPSNRSKKH